MCAMASNRMTGVCETPKISPKNDFLTIRKNFYGLSTPYKRLMFAISSKLYAWNSSESEGKSPNPTPLPHVRLWLSNVFR